MILYVRSLFIYSMTKAHSIYGLNLLICVYIKLLFLILLCYVFNILYLKLIHNNLKSIFVIFNNNIKSFINIKQMACFIFHRKNVSSSASDYFL